MQTTTDIVVIGGGVAGLSVALELQRLGMQTMRDVVVLDAEPGPGGSWGRAWDALPMHMANDLVAPEGLDDFDLGFERADPQASVREIVPRSLAYFEDASNLYVYRPARVTSVTSPRGTPLLHVEYAGPGGRTGRIVCRIVIDATGHWSSPFVPWVPGMREFTGRHVPAARLEHLAELDGQRVLVVGGGRTAVDLMRLLEGRAASLAWATRRDPEFRDVSGDRATRMHRTGQATAPGSATAPVVAPETSGGSEGPGSGAPRAQSTAPEEDAARVGRTRPAPERTLWPGRPGGVRPDARQARPESDRPWAERDAVRRPVGDRAWIPRTAAIDEAIARGLLVSQGALNRFDGATVQFAGGDAAEFDVVVWATGSHVPRRHLAPLRLREPSTNYRASSGWNRRDRRVAIVGDGTEVSSRAAIAHAIEVAAQAADSLESGGLGLY